MEAAGAAGLPRERPGWLSARSMVIPKKPNNRLLDNGLKSVQIDSGSSCGTCPDGNLSQTWLGPGLELGGEEAWGASVSPMLPSDVDSPSQFSSESSEKPLMIVSGMPWYPDIWVLGTVVVEGGVLLDPPEETPPGPLPCVAAAPGVSRVYAGQGTWAGARGSSAADGSIGE